MTEDYENLLPDEEDVLSERRAARPFSHDEMVTCPECLRANPPTRQGCLYCGAELPRSDMTAGLRHPTLRQPEKWEEGFNVVLCRQAKTTKELLAEVAGLLRLSTEAARRILHSARPLPLARLNSAEEARLVHERLSRTGLSVIVVSDSDLLVGDENRKRVRAFDFTKDGITAHAAGSNEVWPAGWSEISLMVTGRHIERRVELEERPKRAGSEAVEAREMIDDLLLLDIYSKAVDGGAWRVASNSFDFSCLGQRKGRITTRNFETLVEVLRERAPEVVLDDSYDSLRHALAPVWPPEERTESRGLRRERPGRYNVEAVMTSDNETQFTRYSRLRHYLLQAQPEG